MTALVTSLHSFTIYALVGVIVGYFLASLVTRRFPDLPPSVRGGLWLVPLAAPLAVFALSWAGGRTGLFTTCPPIVLFTGGPIATVWEWLCGVGTLLAGLLFPFFGLAILGGLGKAGASLVLAARLRRAALSTVHAGADPRRHAPEQDRAGQAVARLSLVMGLNPPPLLVADRTAGWVGDGSAPAFTVGLWRPVLVLARGLVESLDDQELEAVVAHEMAHIAAGDHRRKWLLVTLRDILLFTGLSGAAWRRVEAAMEEAADRRAVAIAVEPLALAGALLKARRLAVSSRRGGDRRRPLAADNFAPSLAADAVIARVERLVLSQAPGAGGGSPSDGPRPGWARVAWARAWTWMPLGLGAAVALVALSIC